MITVLCEQLVASIGKESEPVLFNCIVGYESVVINWMLLLSAMESTAF